MDGLPNIVFGGDKAVLIHCLSFCRRKFRLNWSTCIVEPTKTLFSVILSTSITSPFLEKGLSCLFTPFEYVDCTIALVEEESSAICFGFQLAKSLF